MFDVRQGHVTGFDHVQLEYMMAAHRPGHSSPCYFSSFYKAICEGRKEWVELLLSLGADANISALKDDPHLPAHHDEGYSSIYSAMSNGRLEICKILLDWGVQPQEEDLQLAREKGYDELVDVLSTYSYVDVPQKVTNREANINMACCTSCGQRCRAPG